MTAESLYPIAGTLGGTFLGSFLIGYFIKKIIKILIFVFGGILALLMYLQSQGMISVEVNVDKIQSSMEALVSTIMLNTNNVFPNNSSIVDSNLGIPFTVSVASGFMLGVTRRD
ncbi:MAG TPA: FUN14 domain-containing protein [Nitrososphaeraceae archaeon]|jgi:uncharacterized membrane protein (Fun14 family)|nr:FUN14 domain-containing protein [Nitrososphaeraceae archaeon]